MQPSRDRWGKVSAATYISLLWSLRHPSSETAFLSSQGKERAPACQTYISPAERREKRGASFKVGVLNRGRLGERDKQGGWVRSSQAENMWVPACVLATARETTSHFTEKAKSGICQRYWAICLTNRAVSLSVHLIWQSKKKKKKETNHFQTERHCISYVLSNICLKPLTLNTFRRS